MRQKQLFVMFVAIVASLSAADASAVMKRGLWEITMHTEFPVPLPRDLSRPNDPPPPAKTSPTTWVSCVTKDKAEKPEPPKGRPEDDCKVTSGDLRGNVLAYSVRCTKAKHSSDATFRYHGQTMEGLVIINSDEGEIRQIFTGRWIGECEAAEEEGQRP